MSRSTIWELPLDYGQVQARKQSVGNREDLFIVHILLRQDLNAVTQHLSHGGIGDGFGFAVHPP